MVQMSNELNFSEIPSPIQSKYLRLPTVRKFDKYKPPTFKRPSNSSETNSDEFNGQNKFKRREIPIQTISQLSRKSIDPYPEYVPSHFSSRRSEISTKSIENNQSTDFSWDPMLYTPPLAFSVALRDSCGSGRSLSLNQGHKGWNTQTMVSEDLKNRPPCTIRVKPVTVLPGPIPKKSSFTRNKSKNFPHRTSLGFKDSKDRKKIQ